MSRSTLTWINAHHFKPTSVDDWCILAYHKENETYEVSPIIYFFEDGKWYDLTTGVALNRQPDFFAYVQKRFTIGAR